MTTNQTIDGVPRELRALLERVVGKASQTPHWDALDEDRIAATAELRALLDAKSDHPECSGNPASCPENEGFGCCKENPCITPAGAVCPGDGVGPCKKCPAEQPAPVSFPGYPPVPEDRKLPAPVAVRMCDCNQGRMPCNGKCTPTS